MKFRTLNAYNTTTTGAIVAGDLLIPVPVGVAAALASEITSAGAEVIAFTLTDGGNPETTEIVYVTGASGESVTCTRGMENTTAVGWPSGTVMEARATAGVLNDDSGVFDPYKPMPSGTSTIVYGGWEEGGTQAGYLTSAADWDAYSSWSLAFVNYFANDSNLPTSTYGGQTKRLLDSLIIGQYNAGSAGVALISIGGYRGDVAHNSVYIGDYGSAGVTTASGFMPQYNTVIGSGSGSGCSFSTLIGAGLYQPARDLEAVTLSVGGNNYLWEATRVVSLGFNQWVGNIDGGIIIGSTRDADTHSTECEANYSIVVGSGARSFPAAAESVTIGRRAEVRYPGAMRVAAVPYLPSVIEAGTFVAPAVSRQTTFQVAMATPQIDLTNAAATAEFSLPTGMTLFPDSIDVVITGSAGVTNAAAINVGTDAGNSATLVSAGALASVALAGRTVFDALSKDGLTSVYVSLGAANTGTTSTAKIVVRGYVMEL